MNRHPSISGFTLIEVLLYVAIASVVTLLAFEGFRFFDTVHEQHAAVARVDGEAAFVAERLHEILRTTASISSPGPQQTTGDLQDTDGTVVALAGTTLTIQYDTGTPRALTSARVALSSMSFTNHAEEGTPDIIQVRFTMSASPSAVAAYDHDYTFTISTR